MGRPVTLFTGQWADLKLEDLCKKAADFGYDGLELACWGDHFEVDKALSDDTYCARKCDLLKRYDLKLFAISNHLVGQAVLDKIDGRHKGILPPYVWGDGKPRGVNKRAAEEMKNTARAAQKLGVSVVNGFTGSSVWHLVYNFPPTPNSMYDDGFKLLAERWNPILDVFGECGVRFALEVHPTEIAFDCYTAQRALAALDNREEFGFNFDPSHLICQGVDPAEFIRMFPDRIYHVHMKDAAVTLNGRIGILSSHLGFGDGRRAWDVRKIGRGGVRFEEIIRALNAAGYPQDAPLSVPSQLVADLRGIDTMNGSEPNTRTRPDDRYQSTAFRRTNSHSRRTRRVAKAIRVAQPVAARTPAMVPARTKSVRSEGRATALSAPHKRGWKGRTVDPRAVEDVTRTLTKVLESGDLDKQTKHELFELLNRMTQYERVPEISIADRICAALQAPIGQGVVLLSFLATVITIIAFVVQQSTSTVPSGQFSPSPAALDVIPTRDVQRGESVNSTGRPHQFDRLAVRGMPVNAS